MAELELCTESALGPYLVACDRTTAGLAQRFNTAGVPFEREHPAEQPFDECGLSVIYFGLGANLAAIFHLLSDAGYDWTTAGF